MIALDPIRDTTDRLSWGWFAVAYGQYLGRWITPREASDLTGQPPATLHVWAEAGLISRVQDSRRKERSYLASELRVIATTFPRRLRVTEAMLTEHLDHLTR